MTENYQGIEVDYSRDNLFDKNGLQRLKESYMTEKETSPQQRFAYVSKFFSSNPEHAQRLYGYSSKHWLSYSTPILSFGRNKKGLAISCYLSFIDDTAKGLVDSLSETNWLSMMGGGIGIGFGIRSADDKSTGVMSHLKTYDACCLAYKQGSTRRGSYAAYLNIEHPDIIQFIEMRKATGDANIRCLNLHHAVNISDKFMQLIVTCETDPTTDDTWQLIDPKTKKVVDKVSAKWLWQSLLEIRMQTGEPYFHFIDTSNRHFPQILKDKGLRINQSNLCSEVILSTDNKRTAVCCLSSLNLEYFEQWANDYQFYLDVAEMLDNVLSHFIANAPKEISRAVYSASMERSIGVGALGFHSYLQSKNVSFDSISATFLNNKIFSTIRNHMDTANKALGKRLGSPEDLEGSGLRFAHVMAVAPNASSSIIMGNTSPSIEPYRANAYRQDTISGSFLHKNRHLDKIIKERVSEDKYDSTWSGIISHDGSAQHLDFLTDNEKHVFKTAIEIDQRWIIEHAAVRQEFIDQGQSVNLFFRPDANVQYIHLVHKMAWEKGLKTLYYCRSEKIGKADKISKAVERKVLKQIKQGDVDCISCEG